MICLPTHVIYGQLLLSTNHIRKKLCWRTFYAFQSDLCVSFYKSNDDEVFRLKKMMTKWSDLIPSVSLFLASHLPREQEESNVVGSKAARGVPVGSARQLED